MSRKVFVHNLPYNCDKRDVEEIFKEVGDIVECEMLKTRDGASRGFAILEFSTEEDVERCIRKMNGHKLDGRMITCREDRGTGYIHPDTDRKGKDKGKGKGKFGKGYYDSWDYGKGYGYGGYDKGYGGYGKGWGKGRSDSRRRGGRSVSRGRGGRSRSRGRREDSRRR